MRGIVIMATVLGLASGVLGAFAYGELFGQAGAAPPIVTREAELSIIAGGFVEVSNIVDGAWHDVRDTSYEFMMPIDPARYRDGSFHLELAGEHQLSDPPGTVCLRLAEAVGSDRVGVPGSEVCSTQKGLFFLESSAFTLPSGERVYRLQSKHLDNRILRVDLARVVAEWTERR